jgi:hypothetical protein
MMSIFLGDFKSYNNCLQYDLFIIFIDGFSFVMVISKWLVIIG